MIKIPDNVETFIVPRKGRWKQFWSDLRWLWCMWHARHIYRRLLFTDRIHFMDDLRPPFPGDKTGLMVINHPDAIFHVKPEDLARAVERLRDQPVMQPDEPQQATDT